MSVGFRMSRAWLFWAGLLSAMLAVFLLATGLGTSQALPPPLEGVTVHKEVNVPSILPDTYPDPVYTVVFNNTNDSEVTLDDITDTLPEGFAISGMAVGSQISAWPSGPDFPYGELVWEGPHTIPAQDTLTLRYSVHVGATVPRDVEPYLNNVTASSGDNIVEPASAPLVVGAASLSLQKEASSPRVVHGEAVTYTVTISNSGEMTGTVEIITDTPDDGLTFDGMVMDGDITDDPTVGATLVWNGSWEVPPRSEKVLRYRATTPAGEDRISLCNEISITAPTDLVTSTQTCIDVRPEAEYTFLPIVLHNFEPARFEVEKSASPDALDTTPDQVVRYTVVISNEGDTIGTLTRIEDTLPAGFVFQNMVAGSDLDLTLDGDILVWEGSRAFPPGDQVTLLYEVEASTTPGLYANRVELTAQAGHVPQEPAEAIVSVDLTISGLTASNDSPTPQGMPTTLSADVTAGTNVIYDWQFGDGESGTGRVVEHVYPAEGDYTATVTARNGISQQTTTTDVEIGPAVLLDEDFNDGWSRWTEFLNLYRLEPGQWYWDSNDGYNGTGAVTQENDAVDGKTAEDALLMYLQPGAEDWTNYRMEAKIIIRCDDHPQGLWVRGQYEDVGSADPGGWVTGYYIMIGGSPNKDNHFVSLKQMQTVDDCWDAACNNPENLYDFNNPHELTITKKTGTLERWTWHTVVVEVRGYNIQVWLNGVQYINYDDTKEPFLTGTVGLKTFNADTVSFDDILVTPLP